MLALTKKSCGGILALISTLSGGRASRKRASVRHRKLGTNEQIAVFVTLTLLLALILVLLLR